MKREWWLYGGLTGILLLILQIVEYKAIIRDIELELFGAIIAIIFMGLGVWVAWIFIQRKERHKQQLELKDVSSYGLSEREMEVLTLLGQGLSNQEIADRLFVSLNTIKTHLSNIYGKLGVTRRTQALQKALELKLG